jgi:hypothetical protein
MACLEVCRRIPLNYKEAIINKNRVDECFSYELAVKKINGVVSDVMAASERRKKSDKDN